MLFSVPQPIAVTRSPRGNLLAFDWHGRRHYIKRIEQSWEIDTDWWAVTGRIWRSYYAVITEQDMLIVIFEDLETGDYFVSRLYD